MAAADMAGRAIPDSFDAYLRYAITARFKNFELFDEADSKLFLFVELLDARYAQRFQDAMVRDFGAQFGLATAGSRYLTMRAGKDAVGRGSFHVWNDNVSRVELSLPLKPANVKESLVAQDRRASSDPPTRLLIGVIDDGCPFASMPFLSTIAVGVAKTRLRGIWDQDSDRQAIDTATTRFGATPLGFDYGLEYLRDSATALGGRQIGLNEWMQMHATDTGSIDEDGCYADGRFNTLKHRRSHGAHVMDVLAGRVPPSSRIARVEPPSWLSTNDLASGADLVFVQFPDKCIRDATGVWLKAYVVDGIEYIMSFVDPAVTDHVVINVSYGPTTGPHDGTAPLEAKLTELVNHYDGSSGKPRLEIFLPAGNTYLTANHVAYPTADHAEEPSSPPDYIEWSWRLPPDNTVLCFAEVWMEKNHAHGVSVTLTAPSGASSPPGGGPSLPPGTGVFGPFDWGNDTMWLLAVEPTIAGAGAAIEHGSWTIKVAGLGGYEVHAYVARTDPNMNVRSGAKRSYFVDPQWERTRAAAAAYRYVEGEFDSAGSLVRREGTLNGIATADVTQVQVAGGYLLSLGRKSPYSSAGPARGGTREGPDYVLPCDESYALTGIRAGGNRSGAVFRLIGTSIAAPQLARRRADGQLGSVTNVPTAPGEIHKRGKGDLAPP